MAANPAKYFFFIVSILSSVSALIVRILKSPGSETRKKKMTKKLSTQYQSLDWMLFECSCYNCTCILDFPKTNRHFMKQVCIQEENFCKEIPTMVSVVPKNMEDITQFSKTQMLNSLHTSVHYSGQAMHIHCLRTSAIADLTLKHFHSLRGCESWIDCWLVA